MHQTTMKFLLPLFLFLVCAGNSISQTTALKQHAIDSLTKRLHNDSLYTFRFKTLRPYANIDNRNSFIIKQPANIIGLQLGVVVNTYHIFAFGAYVLNQKSKHDSPIANNYQVDKLSYFTVFYGYVLLNKRYLAIHLPFELGAGNYTAKQTDTMEQAQGKQVKYGFVPLGAGVKVILKPIRWIGLSIMGGYRYVIEGKPSLLNLDGSYYSVGVWVDLRQIYRDVKYYGFQKRRYRAAVKNILEQP